MCGLAVAEDPCNPRRMEWTRRSPYVLDHHGRPMEFASTVARPYGTAVRGGFRGGTGVEGFGGRNRDPAEWSSDWDYFDRRLERVERIVRRCGYASAAYAMRTLPLVNAELSFERPGTDDEPATDLEIAATDWANEQLIEHAPIPTAMLMQWLSRCLRDGVTVVEGSFGNVEWHGKPYLTPVAWEHRKPRSIAKAGAPWTFKARRLEGISQQCSSAPEGKLEQMQARNCFVVTYGGSGGMDIEGESIFRAVDRAEDVIAFCWNVGLIGIERWGSPTPIIELTDDDTAAQLAPKAAEAASAFKVASDAGVTLFPGMKFAVAGASGSDHTPWDKALAMAIDELATGLNVPLLRIGTVSNSGNRALGETFENSAVSVVQADAKVIAAQMQAQQWDPLLRANFGAIRCPRMVIGGIAKRMTEQMLGHFKTMGEIGIELSDADEDHIRSEVGAPPRQEVEVTAPDPSNSDPDTDPGNPSPPPPSAGDDEGGGDSDDDTVTSDESSPPGQREAEREEAEMSAHHAGCGAGCTHEHHDHEMGASVHEVVEGIGGDKYTRPGGLRPHERWVDFRTIDALEDDAVEQVTRIVEEYRQEAIEDLVGKVEALANAGSVKASAIDGLKVDGAIARKMRNAVGRILGELEREGRRSVRREQQRMSAARDAHLSASLDGAELIAAVDALYEFEDPTLPASAPENAPQVVQAQGRSLVRKVLQPLEEMARSALEQALASGQSLAGIAIEALDQLRTTLQERSVSAIAKAAGSIIPTVFGIGRKRGVEAMQAELDVQFRQRNSALLDEKACANCIALENYTESNVVLAGSPLGDATFPPVGPNPITDGCESMAGGGNRCRCIATFTEATPEEIAEAS